MNRWRILGAHAILYSRNAEADRAFLRDVLRLPGVDAGGGWFIFALPPSEVAVHPSEASDRHELFLMSDDVRAFVRSLREKGIQCSSIRKAEWGSATSVTLPGGGTLGVYEPTHPRPPSFARSKAIRRARPAAKGRVRPRAKH